MATNINRSLELMKDYYVIACCDEAAKPYDSFLFGIRLGIKSCLQYMNVNIAELEQLKEKGIQQYHESLTPQTVLMVNSIAPRGRDYVTCTLPADQLPAKNPDTVFIACSLVAEIHGFAVGEGVNVLPRPIEVRDGNGFDIWVHSVLRSRPIYLSHIEYSLTKPL